MSNPMRQDGYQADLFPDEVAQERTMLDQLLSQSRLYHSSNEYRELLDFTIRLRNMAPFNAMLLQIQKPGLRYAASEYDWRTRFNRIVKEHARPLLIMWPFGPVALVYDLLDTEGPELPKDAFMFYAKGKINAQRIEVFENRLTAKEVTLSWFDKGDQSAGQIVRKTAAKDPKVYSKYEIHLNRNHTADMSFVTLAHELAHLFLGHLGEDKKLGITERKRPHRVEEIEAESVAYILCHRNRVECRSQPYLNSFVEANESAADLDLYAITRAAGHIERLLDLSISSQWQEPKK
jgi:hypothetical protein